MKSKKKLKDLEHDDMRFDLDHISRRDVVAITLGKFTLWSARVVKTKTFIVITLFVFLYYVSNAYFMITNKIIEAPGEFVKASEFSNLPKQNDTINALSVHYVKVDNVFKEIALWAKFGKYYEYMSGVTPDTVTTESRLYVGSDMLNMQMSAYLAVNNLIDNQMPYTTDVRITSVPAKDGVNPTLLPNDIVLKVDGKLVKEARDVELAQILNRNHQLEIKRDNVVLTFTSNLIGVEYGKTIYLQDAKDYQNFYAFANLSLKGFRGTSAGAALALDYYNHAIENVAKGRKIALTGTISETGKIGQVGGVKAKTILAIDNKVDIMFIPSDILEARNYSDALSVVDGLHSKMKLVVVDNLSDIIDYLKQ